MMLKKMVTGSGAIYYVLFENTFEDDTLIVYTDRKMKEIASEHQRQGKETKSMGVE